MAEVGVDGAGDQAAVEVFESGIGVVEGGDLGGADKGEVEGMRGDREVT